MTTKCVSLLFWIAQFENDHALKVRRHGQELMNDDAKHSIHSKSIQVEQYMLSKMLIWSVNFKNLHNYYATDQVKVLNFS